MLTDGEGEQPRPASRKPTPKPSDKLHHRREKQQQQVNSTLQGPTKDETADSGGHNAPEDRSHQNPAKPSGNATAGDGNSSNGSEFRDSDYRKHRPAGMKRRHHGKKGAARNRTHAPDSDDRDVAMEDAETADSTGGSSSGGAADEGGSKPSATSGEHESQSLPVNMPDTRKGRHGHRHGKGNSSRGGNHTPPSAAGHTEKPTHPPTSAPKTQPPTTTRRPTTSTSTAGTTSTSMGIVAVGGHQATESPQTSQRPEATPEPQAPAPSPPPPSPAPTPSPPTAAPPSPAPETIAPSPEPAQPAPTPEKRLPSSVTPAPISVPAPRPVPAPAPGATHAPQPPSKDVALPQDFERVERGHAWDTSPYVSQARLDRLWDYLFGKYRKEVPPVPADGGPLPVGVGINFVKFKDFDEVAGTMNIALNLRLCWDDDRLSFNAQEFFNMSWTNEGDKIPIRSDLVWVPDITVLNEVGELHRLLSAHGTPLVLSDDTFRDQTGVNVLWSRPLDVMSNCDVDMSQYPFDEQRCFIVVGSWASSRRQMLLVPQPFFAEYTVHTAEFKVQNITVVKKDVYTRNTAQKFNEVVYCVVLQRYPHFYVINFILPMVALTLLAVATMWMHAGQVGQRVNAGTKLLLCVVSIIFITARHRPAIHGDIWMDRFQSHCIALAMSSVLESLFIDYFTRMAGQITWAPRAEAVDSIMRALICWFAAIIIFTDVCEVRRHNLLELYTSFEAESTRLLVLFVYVMFFGLILSSLCNIAWMGLPRRWQHKILGKDDEVAQERSETLLHSPSKGGLGLKNAVVPLELAAELQVGGELGRRPSAKGGQTAQWTLHGRAGQKYTACPTMEPM